MCRLRGQFKGLMPSDATIAKFKKVVQQELSRELSDREAHDMLNALVQYFSALAQFDRIDSAQAKQ